MSASKASFADLERDRAEEERIKANPGKPPPHPCAGTARLLQCALTSMGGVEFSVVLPSLWVYVQEIAEPGGMTAVSVQLYAQVFFTVAQMLAKFVVGWACDRFGFRFLYALLTLFGAVGGLTYAVARAVGGVNVLLISRLIMGVAGGVSTLTNAFVVRTVDSGRRAEQLATNAACTLIGVFVGPAVVPFFTHIDTTLFGLRADEANLPGLFLFAAFFLLLLPQPWTLFEPPDSSSSNGDTPAGSSSSDGGISRPSRRWLALITDFGLTCIFSMTMFSTTPVVTIVTEDQFGWGPVPNANLFLGVAGFTLVGVLATGNLLKLGMAPTPVLLIACCMLLLHELFAFACGDLVFGSPWVFLSWVGVLAVSYAALNGTNAASLTLTVGAAHIGSYMGLLGFIDALGMACGPLLLDPVFQASRPGSKLTDVLALSRGALTVPTLALLVGYFVRQRWRLADEEAARLELR